MTRGALFLLVGGLAAAAAAGWGGEATDPSGALAALSRAPAGRLVLVAIALGLLMYAAFRGALFFAGEPYEDRGPVWRGVRRFANLIASLLYLGLAITAVSRALGANPHRDPNPDAEAHHWSARLLAAPFGRPLLMGVALAILIAAAVQLVRAFIPNTARRRLRVEDMSEGQRRTMSTVGRIAFVARATVLAGIGYTVGEAALLQRPRLARGAGGALHAVGELPHGALLLALVGGGLMAFGAYCLLEARWRRLFQR